MIGKLFAKPESEDAQAAPPEAKDAQQSPSAQEQQPEAQSGALGDIAGMLNNHKGKLAVGAAAMLGVAVFYKWREGRLAKEDPEEYARLQRLKKAIDSNGGADAENQETGKPV